MRKASIAISLLCSLSCMAQGNDTSIHFPHIMMSNGAVVSPRYNSSTKTLKVEVQDNNDEVEIIAVSNGHVVDSETSIFDNEDIKLDLSNRCNQQLDIYVRTRKEIQYMGRIAPIKK